MGANNGRVDVRRVNLRIVVPDSNDRKSLAPIIGYSQETLLQVAQDA